MIIRAIGPISRDYRNESRRRDGNFHGHRGVENSRYRRRDICPRIARYRREHVGGKKNNPYGDVTRRRSSDKRSDKPRADLNTGRVDLSILMA